MYLEDITHHWFSLIAVHLFLRVIIIFIEELFSIFSILNIINSVYNIYMKNSIYVF